MRFGEKLRTLREGKAWTQKALADAAKTNQQSIGRWEAGLQVPGFDAVQSLCDALGEECTVFKGCDFELVDDKRGRGRPAKVAKPPLKTKAKSKKKS